MGRTGARTLTRLAGAGLLAMGLGGVGLWLWAGQDGSLATALEWLGRQPAAGLQTREVSGSLRHGGRIGELRWQQPGGGLGLQAQGLTLRWELGDWLWRAASGETRIHLQQLQAELLRLEPRPSAGPGGPPASLALPWPVKVDRLQLQQVQWAGAQTLAARELVGAYGFDGAQHELTLHQLQLAAGRYQAQAQARLQAMPPFMTSARLQGRLSQGPEGPALQPLDLQAELQGPLAQIALQLRLRQPAAAGAAAGHAELQARLAPWQDPPMPEAWASLEGLDLGLLWPGAARTDLHGQARIEPQGPGWRFELSLSNHAPGPWALGRLPLDALQAQGRWDAGRWQLAQVLLRGSGARLQGSGQLNVHTGRARGQAQLWAPGLELKAHTDWPLSAGGGRLDLRVDRLAPALDWLRGLPGLPAPLAASLRQLQAQGQAQLALAWTEGLANAQAEARLDLRQLTGAAGLQLSALQASLRGRLRDAQLQARAQLAGTWLSAVEGEGRLTLGPEALGQALAARSVAPLARLSWQLHLQTLALALKDPAGGRWQLSSTGPLVLRSSGLGVDAGPGALAWRPPAALGTAPAVLDWELLRWQDGQVSGQGRVHGIPLAWAASLADDRLKGSGLESDLLLDGRWQAQLGPRLRVHAELQRRSGDLRLPVRTDPGAVVQLAAGVSQARLALDIDGQALALAWAWESERAGQSEGQLRTQWQRDQGRWHWPADAPLDGRLQARLPRLGVWSALAPPGWRLQGSLQADVALSGTRSRPLLSGPLQAEDLSLRSMVDGIAFDRGRLRALLEGEQLRLQEASLRGGSGWLHATGQVRWSGGQPQLSLQARLERLEASLRSDRQLTVSGHLQASLSGPPRQTPLVIRGDLRLDRARFRLTDEDRPALGSDVVLRRADAPGARSGPSARAAAWGPLDLAVQMDLGEDFRVEGRGLDVGLRGRLSVTATDLTQLPRLVGTVQMSAGQYQAFGQRLSIAHGLLRFTGPADNPALDILALRPRLSQRVGVQVSGTALMPRLRLYAEPELPDTEKLGWLVLGRARASTGADSALLQQAAIALLGRRSPAAAAGLAASLGLDELSIHEAPAAQSSGSVAAITLGKRLSSKAYAAYESSLSGTLGTLYLFYELSQRLTVRTQTGAQTAVDLIFSLPYD